MKLWEKVSMAISTRPQSRTNLGNRSLFNRTPTGFFHLRNYLAGSHPILPAAGAGCPAADRWYWQNTAGDLRYPRRNSRTDPTASLRTDPRRAGCPSSCQSLPRSPVGYHGFRHSSDRRRHQRSSDSADIPQASPHPRIGCRCTA